MTETGTDGSCQVNLARSYSRMRLLLDLAIKLNAAFLRAQDLNEILKAVLVGVTAGEGLGFNRAFLIRLNSEKGCLEGVLALGPNDVDEAHRIWSEISHHRLSLFGILDGIRESLHDQSRPLNQLARKIVVPITDRDHILVRALTEGRPVWIGGAGGNGGAAPLDLRQLLGAEEFVAAPLVTEEEIYGVILADNFITRSAICQEDVDGLHLFAGLASIAVGKTRMCEKREERIQKLRTLNEEIERNKDILVQAERYAAIGRMADQLLHEIRNPLSTVGGMANLLHKKLKDTELRGYTEVIVQQTGRLEQTLEELFNFTHDLDLHLEPVRLYQLIEACLVLFQSELDRHNIAWHTHMPVPEPALSLDRLQMQQALLNILKNSVEAMPEGGLLIVSVAVGGQRTEVQVADTGLGIAKGHLSKADEPFFTTKSHGIGLGLNLAKRVIQRHGGSLAISRNRFGGTTVTIVLPNEIS